MSHTESTALLFESEWLLNHLAPPSSCQPPIDSIRDITKTEKIISKTRSIHVASKISYEMIAI